MMEEKKIFGLSNAEIEDITNQICGNVDKNHPKLAASYDSLDDFIKAVEDGSEKIKKDRLFLERMRG